MPEGLSSETVHELRQRFGAVSSETQTIRGLWHHGEQVFRDELVRVFVDVPDLAENRRFFAEYKERLKTRFTSLRSGSRRTSSSLIEVL